MILEGGVDAWCKQQAIVQASATKVDLLLSFKASGENSSVAIYGNAIFPTQLFCRRNILAQTAHRVQFQGGLH